MHGAPSGALPVEAGGPGRSMIDGRLIWRRSGKIGSPDIIIYMHMHHELLIKIVDLGSTVKAARAACIIIIII